MGAVLATLIVAAAVLAAVAGGVGAVTAVAVLLGVAAAVDGSRRFARVGARPVLPVAVVPVVALPLTAAGDPALAWARVGTWYAATFLLAALLLLVSGRRTDAARGLGATMALAGLAGLGSGAMVLVAGLREGMAWLVALALLVVASDLPDRALRVWAARRGYAADRYARVAAIGAVAATVFVGAALATALAGRLWPPVIVVAALVTLAAGRAGVALWPVEAGAEPSAGEAARGAPAAASALTATGTLLLAAPVFYLVVRAGVG